MFSVEELVVMTAVAAPPTGRPRAAGGLAGTAALTALTPMIWGSTYLVTTQLLPPDRPLFAAAVRALPAGLVVLALTRRLPRGAWWWKAAVLGALNIGIFFALLFVAAYRLPGGVAATFGAVQPLMVAALAIPLLGQRPTRWRLAWGVAGVLGVGLVVIRGSVALDGIGLLAALADAAAMSAGIVLTKRWGRPVPLLTFTGWQLTAGGLLLAPLAFAFEGAPPALDGDAVLGFLWLGLFGTLLAYANWFRGLDRLPVVAAAFLTLIAPIVATIIGWLALDQSLTALQLLGMLIAFGAVLAGQLRGRH
jgi:probable blue pigment (indigoidine) exporter